MSRAPLDHAINYQAISETGSYLSITAPFNGVITMLGRRARTLDLRTRSELLEFDVPNPSARLEAGMYADVLVPVVRSTPTMTVPAAAVATSLDGPFVIGVIGDTTHWVRVRKSDIVGDRVEVFGDLRDGERIVDRATEEIRNGVHVRIVAPGPAKGA